MTAGDGALFVEAATSGPDGIARTIWTLGTRAGETQQVEATVDLARTMIHLSGLSEKNAQNPQGDIEIQFLGLRPGEKLFEELLIDDNVVPSGHPRIMSAPERHIEPALLDKMIGSLRSACEGSDTGAMLRQIRILVPEYRAAADVNAEVAASMNRR